MKGWRASIVVRQALASTLVMIVAIAIIGMVARTVLVRQQRSALLATIDTDIAGLADGMAAGGRAEVARRIADRTMLLGPVAASYRLADEQGRVLAGNLPSGGGLDAVRSASGDIATPSGVALARATRLAGGDTLVVARSLAPTLALANRLTGAILVAALGAALVSIAVGALAARRVGIRVRHLDATLRRFAGGDHHARNAGPMGDDEVARLARQVDAHLAHAQQLIETQRQISDNIAHELRTPLGHLDTRLLRALDAPDGEAAAIELHEARAAIRAIVSLFDALLDLALTTPIDRPASPVFDLSERLCELADLYHASAEEAGLVFTCQIAPGVTMPGEPMAMSRAVANLLDNAFKFTAAGHHVRLSLTAGPRIVVEDDGPGIGALDPDRLFERSYKAAGAQAGHGLGLALVKVIAARHGLAAWAEDAQPGARFIIAPARAA